MAISNSSKIVTPGSSSQSGLATVKMNACPFQVPVDHLRSFNGSVSILWDIENCPVPNDVLPEDVAGNIRVALRIHPLIKGAVTMFSAYGDFNKFPRKLREGLQRTGVKLVDVPNGRKDAADKAILIDMFLLALDNPQPSSIVLISGDVDFSPALHILGQRGYTIILVIPDKVGVSSAFSNAGQFVCDWPSIARGEGFVPPKKIASCRSDLACYSLRCHIGDHFDGVNEEAIPCGAQYLITRGNTNHPHIFSSTSVHQDAPNASCPVTTCSGQSMAVAAFFSARSCGPPESPSINQNQVQDEVLCVQPGDIQCLKGQLVRLLELSGGSLPLLHVPALYLKNYGRPLCVAEYGACKLVNLIKKMDSFVVEGKGNDKVLCLQNRCIICENVGTCMSKEDCKGTDKSADVDVRPFASNSSDDFLDDEKVVCVKVDIHPGVATMSTMNSCDNNIESFKQEMQPGDIQGLKDQLVRLLEISGGSLPLAHIPKLYYKNYGRQLCVAEYGARKLVNLVEKMGCSLVVEGTGTDKVLCLQSPGICENVGSFMTKKDCNGKDESVDVGVCPITDSSSDDHSDNEKEVCVKVDNNAGVAAMITTYNCNDNIESVKQEVQVGDIEGLKGQLVRLLEMSGGSLPLACVAVSYFKNYGRQLCVAEYGARKLVNLIKKMDCSFVVEGKGNDTVLCLQNPGSRCENAGSCMIKGTNERDDLGVCPTMCSSSNDFSDHDEKVVCVEVDRHAAAAATGTEYCSNNNIEGFKQEVRGGDIQNLEGQLLRLLEMSGGSLPFMHVSALYARNYGRPLCVAEYGACKLVNLIKKMGCSFIVQGKGNEKVLCLQKPGISCENVGSVMTKGCKGKDGSVDVGVYPIMGSSPDDCSADGRVVCLDVYNHAGAAAMSAPYNYDSSIKVF